MKECVNNSWSCAAPAEQLKEPRKEEKYTMFERFYKQMLELFAKRSFDKQNICVFESKYKRFELNTFSLEVDPEEFISHPANVHITHTTMSRTAITF